MIRKSLIRLGLLALAGFGVFWWLTAPQTVAPTALAGLTPDVPRGERVFNLGGCASCHTAPKAAQTELPVLSGGKRFASPFGTFIAPNISSDPVHGIGGWSVADLASAMRYGTSPDNAHYYPAFPYTSYARVPLQDVVDLSAYLNTLPASDQPSLAHEIPFPFNVRRGLGLWKLMFASDDWIVAADGLSEAALQGRTLVEGLGHCGECHTPRGVLGNLQTAAWLQGAPNPTGKGRIPALTPDSLSWSMADIAEYLKSGFTPEFDTAGGEMAEVVENLATLSDADRLAIAAYLKALPPAR